MIQLRSRIRIRLQLFRVTDPAPGPFFGVKKFEFFKKGFKVGSEDDATNKWLILTLSILCVCQQGTKMSKKIQQVFQVCRIRIQNKQLRTRILIQEKVTDPTGSGSATLIIKLKNPSGGYTLTLLLFNQNLFNTKKDNDNNFVFFIKTKGCPIIQWVHLSLE